jgi:arylsulfatase A-like enzyme
MVEKVDSDIGLLIEALKGADLSENTLVIVSSDHGDGLGAHRWNQKWTLYEESVRVPLIMNLPGRIPTQQVDREHLVSNGLDLFPTICDYAGVEAGSDLPGTSLRTLVEGGRASSWRAYLASETRFSDVWRGLGTEGRMIRTSRYKYVVYSWGAYREQLFDLESDPGEMTNLAVEKRYYSLLENHRRFLSHWLSETSDPFSRAFVNQEDISQDIAGPR